ncbi:MAG TPA: HypC/HybG/HupF family hydrogenase formation chaperone [Chthoniobacterales bacterium]|jgi:hydrogenase expression/formation protein HypC|nr:HypC/HybG/HupF family hydrogenase formation chaperone [Chthoniobacterales bacterium]
MCLAIPGKLIEISADPNGVRMGKANFGGIVKQVCLEYTPEVALGDYVLVHVGFALSKVDEAEAARTYQALERMEQLQELDIPDVRDDGSAPTTPISTNGKHPSDPADRAGEPIASRVP